MDGAKRSGQGVDRRWPEHDPPWRCHWRTSSELALSWFRALEYKWKTLGDGEAHHEPTKVLCLGREDAQRARSGSERSFARRDPITRRKWRLGFPSVRDSEKGTRGGSWVLKRGRLHAFWQEIPWKSELGSCRTLTDSNSQGRKREDAGTRAWVVNDWKGGGEGRTRGCLLDQSGPGWELSAKLGFDQGKIGL